MTMLTLKPIFGNKFYLTNNERFIFCEFNPYENCECDE